MKNSTLRILNQLIERYPLLDCCKQSILNAMDVIIRCYRNGNKVLVCGNGGSAADSDHIVGELMKGFLLERKICDQDQKALIEAFPETANYLIENLQRALPAISLVSQTALMTAFANDKAPDLSFAQQVFGYGVPGDLLIGISTSGNSKNVLYAAQVAKIKQVKVISLTGSKGGKIKGISDILINVPSDETFKIQEYHLPVYHALCAGVENEFFSEED